MLPQLALPEDALEVMLRLLRGRRLVALTGAGCSTESGIPDYRGAGRPARPASPIQHDAFLRRAEVRQRYWARSTVGWARFAAAAPRRVVELHGALAEVLCLCCGAREPRQELQGRLLAANPGWLEAGEAALRPDGDAQVAAAAVADFRVPACLSCGGVLKPDVVFFGGTVAAGVVAAAFALLESAEVLLVVGSSLAVYSGFRFVRRAVERGQPVAVINLGATRGDDLAAARVEGRAGEVLPRLATALCGGR
jgi:NAD-dependent deacetylase sirtuin 4